MFDILSKALGGNLFLVILIAIGVWIYKEVRASLIDVGKQNSDRIDKALLTYGELESALLQYETECTFDLGQKIANAYPFLNKDLLKKLYPLRNMPNQEDLVNEFLLDLKSEIMRLKGLQSDLVSTRPSEYFIGEIAYFINKTKFSSFVEPIIFLVIAFLVIGILTIFTVKVENMDMFGQIQMFILLATIISNFVLFTILINVLIDKKFKHNRKNWFLLCGFVIIPGFLCWATHFYWLFILIDLTLNWIYAINFLRDSFEHHTASDT